MNGDTVTVDRSRRALLLGRCASHPADAGRRTAIIGNACFARRGIACMTCRDACADDAIRFVLAVGGAQPHVDAGRCTGCGECVASCPAGAVELPPGAPESQRGG
jgi:ferredoxin-type protein NapF